MSGFRTLSALPDTQGARFGSLTIGYDRAENIREEFSLLRNFAARIIGVAPEALTPDDLSAYEAKLDEAKG